MTRLSEKNPTFLSNALDAWFFRFLIFLAGIALFIFYTILLVGAVANLPFSWIGVLYSLFGIAAGITCVIYFYTRRKTLLIVIIPALILMLLTLSGRF